MTSSQPDPAGERQRYEFTASDGLYQVWHDGTFICVEDINTQDEILLPVDVAAKVAQAILEVSRQAGEKSER